jgi:5'-nucleotidase (lipoprotein e(P4) family)
MKQPCFPDELEKFFSWHFAWNGFNGLMCWYRVFRPIFTIFSPQTTFDFSSMKYRTMIMACAMTWVVSGCVQPEPQSNQQYLLQAVTWFQQSPEMKALYYQSYNWAGIQLGRSIELGAGKPLAVVLDIDETVLDNSPQTARQIIDGEPFSDNNWEEWCNLAIAKPLPGALEFTRMAADRGVELFYISNRWIHLLGVTIRNLKEAGFPCADSLHVLLKTGSSEKDSRRETVSQTHKIVLLIGDNLGDFSGIFDHRTDGNADQQVEEQKALFGTRFIILPNPLYGAWETPFRGKTQEDAIRLRMEALRSYPR